MRSYYLKITDPMQIPAAVYETRARAKDGAVYVFLDHQEHPNVVRGRFQPFENNGITEIKRPDGGLSWYHPHTKCMIQATPTNDGRRIASMQEQWGEHLKEWLVKRGYRPSSLVYDSSDLFLVNGSTKHIVGMSGSIGRENGTMIKLQRACWYEKDPVNCIASMLKADGIDPCAFRNRLQLVKPGLFETIVEKLQAESVCADKFISELSMQRAIALQSCKDGNYRGSCVMGVKENI